MYIKYPICFGGLTVGDVLTFYLKYIYYVVIMRFYRDNLWMKYHTRILYKVVCTSCKILNWEVVNRREWLYLRGVNILWKVDT